MATKLDSNCIVMTGKMWNTCFRNKVIAGERFSETSKEFGAEKEPENEDISWCGYIKWRNSTWTVIGWKKRNGRSAFVEIIRTSLIIALDNKEVTPRKLSPVKEEKPPVKYKDTFSKIVILSKSQRL